MKHQDAKYTQAEGQRLTSYMSPAPLFVLWECLVFDLPLLLLAADGKYAVEEINASANTPDYISAPPEALISTSVFHIVTCDLSAVSRKQKYAVLLAANLDAFMGNMNSLAIDSPLLPYRA